jgi:peptide/nickel transport system ATP-binding protein
MAILEVEALSVSIGDKVLLDNLTFQVEAGTILGLVGDSGSGKSTTLLSVIGLPPDGARLSGQVRVNGVDLVALPDPALCAVRGTTVGTVFQDSASSLNPLLSIRQQVAEGLRRHRGLSRSDAGAVAERTLERVGLGDVSPDRYPHQLSGGQRQRVAIAAAIALHPKLLLADEPTAALDVTTRAEILALLRDLVRETDMALVLVSHDLPSVAAISDQVAVISDGRIAEQGPLSQVFTDPGHAATRRLLTHAERPARIDRPAPGPVLLRASGLSHRYAPPARPFGWRKSASRPALDDVDLTVRAGEIVAVVGESGSGKSTLLRRLLALTPAQQGQVFLGQDQFSPAPTEVERRLRRHIQIVFQDPYDSFDPRWTVGQVVAEPLALAPHPPSTAQRRQAVGKALLAVGLTAEDAPRLPRHLSGGQRQRVAIARALVLDPQVILLDEATSALDEAAKTQVLDLLADRVLRQGLALLFASHDLAMARRFADRILVMQNGRIVEQGSAEQIFALPRHPFTRQLLAAGTTVEAALLERAGPPPQCQEAW